MYRKRVLKFNFLIVIVVYKYTDNNISNKTKLNKKK